MTDNLCLFTAKSTFKTVWEIFIIIIAFLISLILPFTISMKPSFSETVGYQIFMLIIDLIFFIDIIFTFRSATFDIMTGEEVTEPGHIAKKYVLSFRFLLDVLSFLPWEQFGSQDIFRLLGIFKIVRVTRLGSILNTLNVSSGTKIVRNFPSPI
jgi:hypothetical protein